ncbi:hypothetical protein SAMN05518847_101983 [Paenibacillus sp. OV219]|nr:hypothetical protein SAMN05518847_101983 [Paenibacillus sp. OV219]
MDLRTSNVMLVISIALLSLVSFPLNGTSKSYHPFVAKRKRLFTNLFILHQTTLYIVSRFEISGSYPLLNCEFVVLDIIHLHWHFRFEQLILELELIG